MSREVIRLTGWDQHFVLYAKGYYGPTRVENLEEDLGKIVAHCTAMERKYVLIGDIYQLVSKTFVKLCASQMEDFLDKLFFRSGASILGRTTVTRLDIVREMISYISIIRMDGTRGDILEMGEPDPAIVRALRE